MDCRNYRIQELLVGLVNELSLPTHYHHANFVSPTVQILPSIEAHSWVLAYRSLMDQVIETCEHGSERNKLLVDLIHMHVNRLFSDHQRMHEALLYQYLVQQLKSKRAIALAQRKYSA